MSGTTRVFITGLSALSACGETVESIWAALLAGQSGIAEIQQWDVSTWPSRLGGELKNFQPAKMLPDRKLLKAISRQDVIGIHAAIQAINHSGLCTYRETLAIPDEFNNQTAVYAGSPGNKYFQQYDFLPLLAKTENMQQFAQQLFNEIHPMWLLRILPNNVLAYTGINYGFKGPNHNITNHAVGGAQALLEAYQAIRSGQAERAVVIGYDMGIEPQALFYYDKLGVVSSRHLKPFDHEHDGTVLADGAAAIVLESEASVKTRAATCYAELAGGLTATEANGLFALDDEGTHLETLLRDCLDQQHLSDTDVAVVIAHGNGNKKSDNSEARAIRNVFTHSVPVTAFKWALGHTLCASGIIDAVLATYTLRQRLIPGIANFTQHAAECAGLNISSATKNLTQGDCALVINRGFASMNVCLVIKACE